MSLGTRQQQQQQQQQGNAKYFVIRTCPMLKAPAIFLSWEDCQSHMKIEDDDEPSSIVEYDKFENFADAMNYILDHNVQRSSNKIEKTSTIKKRRSRKPAATLTTATSPSTFRISGGSRSDVPANRWEEDNDNGGCSSRPQKTPRQLTSNLNTEAANHPQKAMTNFATTQWKQWHVAPTPPTDNTVVAPLLLQFCAEQRMQQVNNPSMNSAASITTTTTTANQPRNIVEKDKENKNKSSNNTKKLSKRKSMTAEEAEQDKREKFQAEFERKIKLLQEFKSEFGDTDVPYGRAKYEINGKKFDNEHKYRGLGVWVSHVRPQFKIYQAGCQTHSLLTAPQAQQLKALDFCMKPVRYKNNKSYVPVWDEEKFNELVEFNRQHRHCNVFSREVQSKQYALYNWGEKLRKAYKDMQTDDNHPGLTQDQITKLSDLGFKFVPMKSYTVEERMVQWANYRKEHDGKLPPSNHALGRWTDYIRAEFRIFKQGEKQTALTQTHIDQMTALGFDWRENVPVRKFAKMKSFEERLQEMRAYKEENGHTRVPQKAGSLGQWVNGIRQEYNRFIKGERSTLTQEKIDRLKEVDFSFERQYVGRKPGGLVGRKYAKRKTTDKKLGDEAQNNGGKKQRTNDADNKDKE